MVVQQIALLMGCAVLPYLRELVEIVGHGLTDEQPKVRMMAALTVAALAAVMRSLLIPKNPNRSSMVSLTM